MLDLGSPRGPGSFPSKSARPSPLQTLGQKSLRRSASLGGAVRTSLRPFGWLLVGWLISTLINLASHPACYLPVKESSVKESEPSALLAMDLRPRFVLFGDSLSQRSFEPGGWGAALQDRYARKVDVVNRGYSGYNTRWASYLLPKIFPLDSGLPAPALVTIFFGANDAALPDKLSASQHVPISKYKRRLVEFVQHLSLLSKKTKVILIAPPPVDIPGRKRYAREAYGAGDEWEPERTNEHTGLYAAACREVGETSGVPVVDLWTIFQQDDNWAEYLNDGLHFTEKGSAVVFKHVLAAIEKLPGEPSLAFDALPWDYPIHSDIDFKDPKRTFQEWDAKKTNS